ncbi:hypothetical protein HRbin15_00141 [bacterium HR15]|nr:hypothetical protein HRbin15_00141 [bacterium HR15]
MGELVEMVRWIAIGVGMFFLPMWVIGLIEVVLEHRREMKQLDTSNKALLQQLQALREEMAELRRTTTEHQLSLQANMEDLQERVHTLETEQKAHQVIRSS